MKTILKKFDEAIPEIIGGVIAQLIFITVAFLFKDKNPWLSLLIAVSGSVWIVCAYIAFRHKTQMVKQKRNKKKIRVKKRVWRFPKYRAYGLVGFILIPIGVLGWFAFDYYQRIKPPDDVLILIANFDGPDADRYRVTETVTARLKDALEDYDDVRVESLDRSITEAEGSEFARSLGHENKATIVLWGWYGLTEEAVPLSVHFELLFSEKAEGYYHLESNPAVDGQIEIREVEDLESFSLQTTLSNDLAYLALYTVGVVRYAASDYDGVITSFKEALNQTSEPIPDIERSVLYRGIADAYNDQGQHAAAIPYYVQALELNPDWAVLWHNLSWAYNGLGVPEQALPLADKAISLESNAANYIGLLTM